MSVLPPVVLRHDEALIKLAHGMTLVIYFLFHYEITIHVCSGSQLF